MFGIGKRKIKVMVNGLPGKMPTKVAKYVLRADDMELITNSLTGPEIMGSEYPLDTVLVNLITPNQREELIQDLKREYGSFISVDFVKDPNNPDLPYDQADFYCRHCLPFVMGSVGGKRDKPGQDNSDTVQQRVRDSDIAAVIAPNMAKQIVALQELIESHSNAYPNSLDGYTLKITESHQKAKAKETSGTAKAMAAYFNKLGLGFSVDQITKIREPEEQLRLGVPEEFLDAHGWHTYVLTPSEIRYKQSIENLAQAVSGFLSDSDVFKGYTLKETDLGEARIIDRISQDNTVYFRAVLGVSDGNLQIVHNVNGRDIYALGALDGARFLHKKRKEKGKSYSMIDVSKGK